MIGRVTQEEYIKALDWSRANEQLRHVLNEGLGRQRAIMLSLHDDCGGILAIFDSPRVAEFHAAGEALRAIQGGLEEVETADALCRQTIEAFRSQLRARRIRVSRNAKRSAGHLAPLRRQKSRRIPEDKEFGRTDLPCPVVSMPDDYRCGAHLLKDDVDRRAAQIMRWAPWARRDHASRRYEGFQR